MTLAAGILTLALAAAPHDALVLEALEASTAARVQLLDTRLGLPEGCRATEVRVAGPLERSGVVALEVEGRAGGGRCHAKGWAQVRLFAPVWVTATTVREGQPLDGAVARAERELSPGLEPLETLPDGARARGTLARGTVLQPRHLRRPGPAPGERVVVEVRVGAVRLEQDAVAVSCGATPCARLANGARVEGTFVDGKLVVTP
jgi:hypothetical protein